MNINNMKIKRMQILAHIDDLLKLCNCTPKAETDCKNCLEIRKLSAALITLVKERKVIEEETAADGSETIFQNLTDLKNGFVPSDKAPEIEIKGEKYQFMHIYNEGVYDLYYYESEKQNYVVIKAHFNNVTLVRNIKKGAIKGYENINKMA